MQPHPEAGAVSLQQAVSALMAVKLHQLPADGAALCVKAAQGCTCVHLPLHQMLEVTAPQYRSW